MGDKTHIVELLDQILDETSEKPQLQEKVLDLRDALFQAQQMADQYSLKIKTLEEAIEKLKSPAHRIGIREKDKISQISFLVKNEIGYKNLIYLSSISYLNKGSDIGITIKDLENHSEGLFCFIGGEYNPLMILYNENKNTDELINIFKKLFKENLLFELQRINDSEIDSFENVLIKKSNEFNVPLVGTNNIKFGEQEEFAAHDALLCVAQKTTIIMLIILETPISMAGFH